jgi:hypothetical protein
MNGREYSNGMLIMSAEAVGPVMLVVVPFPPDFPARS